MSARGPRDPQTDDVTSPSRSTALRVGHFTAGGHPYMMSKHGGRPRVWPTVDRYGEWVAREKHVHNENFKQVHISEGLMHVTASRDPRDPLPQTKVHDIRGISFDWPAP